MPYDDPDPQDPMMLVGVALPADPAAQRDMACAFAEEFARLGYSGRQIVSLFKEPFYAGAHGAWLQLGQAEVERIINETVDVWGRMRLVDRDGPGPEGVPCSGGCDHE
jgi:hypothetical protein